MIKFAQFEAWQKFANFAVDIHENGSLAQETLGPYSTNITWGI